MKKYKSNIKNVLKKSETKLPFIKERNYILYMTKLCSECCNYCKIYTVSEKTILNCKYFKRK